MSRGVDPSWAPEKYIEKGQFQYHVMLSLIVVRYGQCLNHASSLERKFTTLTP